MLCALSLSWRHEMLWNVEGAHAIARALEPSRVNRTLCARKKWAHQVHKLTEICPSSIFMP
eukprot:3206851-Pleurochrysis_carterae.AAC.1